VLCQEQNHNILCFAAFLPLLTKTLFLQICKSTKTRGFQDVVLFEIWQNKQKHGAKVPFLPFSKPNICH
jgi:hypothetical protein